MEITRYLCEFFFGHFWHYMGLLMIVSVISGCSVVRFINKEEKEKEQDNK